MRVDPNVLCRMLERVEEAPQPELVAMPMCDQDRAVAAYHIRVLISGGYLDARIVDGGGPRNLSLTVAGQRFLDELRSASPIMRAFGESAVRVTTNILISLLLAKLRAAGLALGI